MLALLATLAVPASSTAAEALQDTPGAGVPDLAQSVPGGEAVIWYLGHMDYAVHTAGHLLIFD